MPKHDPIAKAFYNLNQRGKSHTWASLEDFRLDVEALIPQGGRAADKGLLADSGYPMDFFPNGLQLTLKKGETVYSKDTIELAPIKKIARNRVNNKLVTLAIDGKEETKPLVVWCEQLNRDYNTVQLRLQRGWSQQRAFNQPTNKPYRDKVQTPYRSKNPVTLPPCE